MSDMKTNYWISVEGTFYKGHQMISDASLDVNSVDMETRSAPFYFILHNSKLLFYYNQLHRVDRK
jgi:hypothetical protein